MDHNTDSSDGSLVLRSDLNDEDAMYDFMASIGLCPLVPPASCLGNALAESLRASTPPAPVQSPATPPSALVLSEPPSSATLSSSFDAWLSPSATSQETSPAPRVPPLTLPLEVLDAPSPPQIAMLAEATACVRILVASYAALGVHVPAKDPRLCGKTLTTLHLLPRPQTPGHLSLPHSASRKTS